MVAASPGEFAPAARLLRIVEILGGKRQYGFAGELPLDELPRVMQWLAAHAGPGLYCVQALDIADGQIRGSVELRVAVDLRVAPTAPLAAAPVAAAAAPPADPFAGALSLVTAVVNITKALVPSAPAAAAAAPAFDPVKIFTSGLELGQLAKAGGKKSKGMMVLVDAVKDNAEVILPLANGALELGKGVLDWMRDLTNEAKKDKAAAAAATAASTPTPAASPPVTEGAQPPETGGDPAEAPPATESTQDTEMTPTPQEPAA